MKLIMFKSNKKELRRCTKEEFNQYYQKKVKKEVDGWEEARKDLKKNGKKYRNAKVAYAFDDENSTVYIYGEDGLTLKLAEEITLFMSCGTDEKSVARRKKHPFLANIKTLSKNDETKIKTSVKKSNKFIEKKQVEKDFQVYLLKNGKFVKAVSKDYTDMMLDEKEIIDQLKEYTIFENTLGKNVRYGANLIYGANPKDGKYNKVCICGWNLTDKVIEEIVEKGGYIFFDCFPPNQEFYKEKDRNTLTYEYTKMAIDSKVSDGVRAALTKIAYLLKRQENIITKNFMFK